MLDVAGWLAEQGLGHHAEAFAENGIGGDVLRDLTDADLRELGLNLGDRKRLLKAIAALDAAPAQDRAEAAEQTTPPATPREAERRQLTVMFVDLVGSTELASRLDPEHMSALIRAYQNAVAGEIARFEGHVAKFMGDGVLAYFGWPRAHEDEAERAARAGLAVVEGVRRLGPSVDAALRCRVGVATGLVVVGDLVAEGAAREEAVVAGTPNLAARLQQLAKPGNVFIAESTRQLLGELFELDPLPRATVKGFSAAVRAFRVVAERPAEGRFEAHHPDLVAPLVGRDQELALLLDRWAMARSGEGQVVLLGGEPGIGKSTIVLALREHLRAVPRISLRYHCSPYHVNLPLWPVISHLERAADFGREGAPEKRVEKLRELLCRGSADGDAVLPLICDLLGLPTGGVLDGLTPQAKKARTHDALIGQIEGLAAQSPVLLVLEDAHWLDPTTQELFEQLMERLRRMRALLVVTYRPEWRPPPWVGLRGYPEQALARNAQGLAHAEALGQPQVVAHAHNWGSMLLQLAGQFDELARRTDALARLADEHGLAMYYPEARFFATWLAAREEHNRRKAEALRAFLDRRAAMGTIYLQPYYLMMLADARLHLGEPEAAHVAIEEGLARAEAGGEHLCTAELHRLSARAALARDRRGRSGRDVATRGPQKCASAFLAHI